VPKGIPLTEEEREQVRGRIFREASKLFLQQGFHETSMRQIAAKTRMGKSTIYDYFPSKEEILLFFVEEEIAETNAMAVSIAEENLSPTEKLRRILHSLWFDLERNREMVALFTREAARLGEAATRRVIKKRLQFRAVLQEIIEEGITEGDFRHMDPETLASALHSLITMPFYDWLRRGETEGGIKIADSMIDLFLNGVRKH
jgi:AcrR family transcriptional regulator